VLSGLCLWCTQPDTQGYRRAPGLALLESFSADSLPSLPMLLLKRCAALRSNPEDRAGEDILVCKPDDDDWLLFAEARE